MRATSAAGFLPRLLVTLILALMPALGTAPAWGQAAGGGDAPAESVEGRVEGAIDTLIGILEDEEAREAFIAELQGAVAAAGEDAEESGLDMRSVGGEIAAFTQGLVEGAVAGAVDFWDQLAAAPQTFSALTAGELGQIGLILVDLAALVAITYGVLILLRRFLGGLRGRLRDAVAAEGFIAKLIGISLGFLIDIGFALVPWAVGYLAALTVLGNQGQINFSHSLYLNAFLVIEITLAVMRVILAPRRPDLRLVSVSDTTARGAMGWGRTLISLFVYGQLLMLPLVTRLVDPQAGRALSVIVLLIILALIASLVMAIRRPVALKLARRWRIHHAGRGKHMAARYWAVPILIYLAVLALIVIVRPTSGFYAVIVANAEIAVAILVGMIAYNLITRMIGGGISLPHNITERVPLLEKRLNAFVPRVLYVVRLVVVLAVIVFCLNALGAFDVFAFLESQIGYQLAGTTITVAVILLVAFAAWLVLNSWVDYRINPDYATGVSAREKTLLVLLRNAVTIALIVIVLMFVLAEVGLNIAPLLASAGIIGLAVGFGAQKMVQDIITGVFIQLEGAIDVGDVVQIGGISGVVERLTIRSAALRDLEGAYHIVPFSSVDVVTNYMRGFSYALLDIGVAYREDTEEAKKAIYDAFEELRADPENAKVIIGDLEWMGLNEFGASEIILRARIKTLPGNQWALKRAYNAILKRIFDERNIEIPFPHQTVYFGVDKAGNAPPLHMVRDDTEETEIEAEAAEPRSKRRRRRSNKDEVGLPAADEGTDAGDPPQ
ncbi:mechanosensitive ion channel domain-containing protein [Pelagibacterium xiamenense]|uniref:mechanosensitive ion channel domain-containing protein n=1 Tax=Pelagibacterium xiamenense TaxID=2901140 RepID=UPI001E58304C|nr:mechanosensitive ion channel domain-containing protein [Pelagibacterium xiamenense]MCD7058601.1 mechanosensitive ion channel [Pelagibacterium xiamenense]